MRNPLKINAILSFLTVAIIVSAMFFNVLASTQNSFEIGTSGSIFYLSQSPTPTPTPTITPTPTQAPTGGRTNLVGFADDYLMWGNWNGNPSYWNTKLAYVAYAGSTPLQVLSNWHCGGIRLFFTFPNDPGVSGSPHDAGNWGSASTYSYSKMDQVLTYLSSVGVKGIPCDYSSEGVNQAGSAWWGSQGWVDGWKAIATSFKGDTRIAAFELCNEPFDQFWSPTGPTGGVTNLATLDTALKYLIDQIHAIDPTRVIMFPNIVGIKASTTSQINAWFSDLDAKGITTDSLVSFDFAHPYYYQSPQMDTVTTNWNPPSSYGNPSSDSIANAESIWNIWCMPQISHFGAARCWSGEMFCWTRWDPNSGSDGQGQLGDTHIDFHGQDLFVKAMIQHFVDAGIGGFQMLQFMDHEDSYAQKDALTNSAYNALIY